MALNDKKLNGLKIDKKAYKVSDGGGLYIHVSPHGSKLWRMAYRYNGLQKLLSFGPYPAVTLAAARAKREAARALLAAKLDPAYQAKVEKQARRSAGKNTFGAVARAFLEKNEREGKADATLAKKRWLIGLALPDLGSRPIADIAASEILIPLRKIEALGNYETARRLRAVIGQVFRFAISGAMANNDPTFGLKGALTTPAVTHRAAQTNRDDFNRLLRAIWHYEGALETQIALKLMAVLYPRPGELRQAEWVEFDLSKAIWTIPEKRTKMRREHRKPLPSLAIDLLRDLQRHNGNRRLVFPNTHYAERPLSENTLNAALRRLGYTGAEATSHGFRASASSILNESGLFNADAIEVELGHVGADDVRRAYHRATYWIERVKMSEWWAQTILGALE